MAEMSILIVLFLLLVFLILAVGFTILLIQTPDVTHLVTENPEESAFMRYRDRQFHYDPGQKRRKWTELSKISPYLIQSLIVAEDRTFLTHKGFYWEEMWISLLTNVREKRIVKGGSSITQQLAKNLFLSPSRSVSRKIREAMITYKLENTLTKARILELYVNVIEWGENIYGAEEASRYYFNKSANELRLSEAILLAACITNPRVLTPFDHSNDYLTSRQRRILTGLWKDGWISGPKLMQTFVDLDSFVKSSYAQPEFVPFEEPQPSLSTPHFWISKVKDPDKRIMDEREIKVFNQRACLISGGIDIFSFAESICCEEIREKIMEVSGLEPFHILSLGMYANPNEAEFFMRKYFGEIIMRYGGDDEPLKTDFYMNVLGNMNLEDLNEDKKVNYALTIRLTNVLVWPCDELVMNKPFDYEFNGLQQSSLNIAEPVAVFHKSRDGVWAFIRTRFVDGWVRMNDLAFSGREEVIGYPGERFLVVTSASCRTESGTELRMGTKLFLLAENNGNYDFNLPFRDENGLLKYKRDTLPAEHVNDGFLEYTKANSIKTAFKLLGTAYGWGGFNGGMDCSSYLQSVFSVFGIVLPRNSSVQTAVGKKISRYDNTNRSLRIKARQIEDWEPGITQLRFPGHIMLFLGENEGKYYAIHSVWGITDENNKIIRINKVSVTRLGLGVGSPNGSLIERVSDAATVDLEKPGLMSFIRDIRHALQMHPWRVHVTLGAVVVIAIVLALVLKLL